MSRINQKNLSMEVTAKEKKLVLSVMKKYDFEVHNIIKARSAYKLETDKGSICLKRMKHGKNKAHNGNLLVKELNHNNFYNTSKYICTKEGLLFVNINKLVFYVTEWINGYECDLGSITEAENCSKLLAEFHIATNKINTKGFDIKNNLKNWPEIFNGNLNDLERFKSVIQRKKLKSEFDLKYLSHIESFYNTGRSLIGLLDASDYYKLSKAAMENKTICHDSFYYQNIIKAEEKYYIIDLDSIIIDLQINDLGKFIRRLMYKTEYQWNFDKALLIINAYNSVYKLSKNEYEVMIALIMFPHKFWKLGKKRYEKYKNWNEAKYLHKLDRLINYHEPQQKFLKEYVAYVDKLF
ncbi:MAG: CotS family spore coat protein [Clostridiaceae bacterium]|nr:CotS family spore coat protein [Clostridiaceae bacterium]